MRALVTQSKLQHIAKAQSEEMEMLRAELERARLRTFPSFVERERTDRVHLPDIGRPNCDAEDERRGERLRRVKNGSVLIRYTDGQRAPDRYNLPMSHRMPSSMPSP